MCCGQLSLYNSAQPSHPSAVQTQSSSSQAKPKAKGHNTLVTPFFDSPRYATDSAPVPPNQ